MVRRRRDARVRVAFVVVGLSVAAVAGCSDSTDGDDDGAGATVTAASASTPPVTSPVTPGEQTDPAGTDAPRATVADGGVPGIDSADPFCRAWSEFAGSFQALAFASAAGSDPGDALRLEAVAAAAVTSAVLELDATFPQPIAGERIVFVDEVIGPFARRAERAVDELRRAGVTSEQLDALGDVWLAALAKSGIDEPDLVVSLPDELEQVVGDATAALASTLPPIAEDPSLITQAAAPATFDYLEARCPDQGTLAGNDAVD